MALEQAECRNQETGENTHCHIHAIMFALVMVWFTVSPCDALMDGFYLHVLYQSFNVKPSNFVKNKQTKTTKMQLKKKSKEKSKMELFFILRFFFSKYYSAVDYCELGVIRMLNSLSNITIEKYEIFCYCLFCSRTVNWIGRHNIKLILEQSISSLKIGYHRSN